MAEREDGTSGGDDERLSGTKEAAKMVIDLEGNMIFPEVSIRFCFVVLQNLVTGIYLARIIDFKADTRWDAYTSSPIHRFSAIRTLCISDRDIRAYILISGDELRDPRPRHPPLHQRQRDIPPPRTNSRPALGLYHVLHDLLCIPDSAVHKLHALQYFGNYHILKY